MSWFKVDDKFAFHPKAISAGNAALGLWVRAGSWAMGNLTDGYLPKSMLGALGGQKRDALKLIESGLWKTAKLHRKSHTAHTPPTHGAHEFDVIDGLEWGEIDGFFFKDWPDWNDTKERVYAEREASKKRAREFRERKRNGVTNALGTRGVRPPNPTHIDKDKSLSSSDSSESDLPPTEDRPEIIALLDRLDARVEANGFKRPNRTKQNVSAARLLLDLDQHSPEQVAWMIDWATGHEFWRTNIRSMSKFREKFETLVAQAAQQGGGAPRQGPGLEVDPDAVLGRDVWTPPAPPDELSDAEQREWVRQQYAARRAERLSLARQRLGVAS